MTMCERKRYIRFMTPPLPTYKLYTCVLYVHVYMNIQIPLPKRVGGGWGYLAICATAGNYTSGENSDRHSQHLTTVI